MSSPITIIDSQAAAPGLCIHCGSAVPDSQGRFCCGGCEFVYNFLHSNGLESFYDLRGRFGMLQKPRPARKAGEQHYSHFDGPEFIETYIRVENGRARLTCYCPSIHCTACIWLIERLPELDHGVVSARVSLASAVVEVVFDLKRTKPSQIAVLLSSLGYRPQPIKEGESRSKNAHAPDDLLIKIGIAGMSAGNVMMVAVSLYQGWFSGIEQKYLGFFQWASMLIAAPAVFYSALPFYRTSLAALRLRRLHIDLLISAGIFAGYAASGINTVLRRPEVYFDSVCMLVFFLLLGRWLQRRGIDRAIAGVRFAFALAPISARRLSSLDQAQSEEVFIGALAEGDLVEVRTNETIPCDGQVAAGRSAVDLSILTGESDPVTVGAGDAVFAGTMNLSAALTIRTAAVGPESRLGKLMLLIEDALQKKSRITEITERISTRFISAVAVLVLITFCFWWTAAGFGPALNHSLALLIVCCPCALALASPIAVTLAVHHGAKNGVFFKGGDVIERLAGVKTVFFDKTGTLTTGNAALVHFVPAADLNHETRRQLFKAAAALEAGTAHPVGRALRRFCEEQLDDGKDAESLTILDRRVEIGCGVEGTDRSGDLWQIGSGSWLGEEGAEQELSGEKGRKTSVFAALNRRIVARFEFEEELREDAARCVQELKDLGLAVRILSGDSSRAVERVTALLAVDSAAGGLSPEAKVKRVRCAEEQKGPAAVIGDGVNDAAALGAASVGLAITGGAEQSIRAADVFLAEPRLRLVSASIRGARTVVCAVRCNLGFSAVYNLLGAACAATGHLSPLLAAVLMPASSLTVVLSSLFFIRRAFPSEEPAEKCNAVAFSGEGPKRNDAFSRCP